jgi:hypothetical protein
MLVLIEKLLIGVRIDFNDVFKVVNSLQPSLFIDG